MTAPGSRTLTVGVLLLIALTACTTDKQAATRQAESRLRDRYHYYRLGVEAAVQEGDPAKVAAALRSEQAIILLDPQATGGMEARVELFIGIQLNGGAGQFNGSEGGSRGCQHQTRTADERLGKHPLPPRHTRAGRHTEDHDRDRPRLTRREVPWAICWG